MKRILMILLAVLSVQMAGAQRVALKTNLIYDAAYTPNLGVEIGLGKRSTLDISGNYNGWKLSHQRQWKHWLVQPEYRYWLCESFNGSFLAAHVHGGEYSFANIALPFGLVKDMKHNRYEGYFYGAGIGFGHQWILGKRWSFEAEIGVGYARIYWEKYPCNNCSPMIGKGHENYWGPTKAALSLIFFIN